jgi:GNAT superfamily N-acetyltransferase
MGDRGAYPTRMEIRRIREDEWRGYRGVRLRSLESDPSAFGATLDEERRASSGATMVDRAMFVADDGSRFQGMVVGFLLLNPRGLADMAGLWVDPSFRGWGVGRALLDTVIAWARDWGTTRIQAWVTETNAPAIAFFAGAGFAPTGDRDQLASDPSLSILLMRRDLREPPS